MHTHTHTKGTKIHTDKCKHIHIHYFEIYLDIYNKYNTLDRQEEREKKQLDVHAYILIYTHTHKVDTCKYIYKIKELNKKNLELKRTTPLSE